MADQILQQRKQNQLPPINPMALIRAESPDARSAEKFLYQARQLSQRVNTLHSELTFIGPLPAMLERRANRYRFVLQISAPQRSILQQSLVLLATEMSKMKLSRHLRWSIDVDPQEM